LGDFSPIRLLFVGSLKKFPKNGNTLGCKFNTFSPKYAVQKWFLIWHYFVWKLIWLLFKKLSNFFSKPSGHPDL
jgi:hypothetical protein